MACKGCGGTGINAAYQQNFDMESTAWVQPKPGMVFSQKKIVGPSGRAYYLSSNTIMLEVAEYDLPVILGYNKRGVYYFEKVTDEQAIADFQKSVEVEQTQKNKAVKYSLEAKHRTRQAERKGRVYGYLERMVAGEVQFSEVEQQIRADLDKAHVSQSEINSAFQEYYVNGHLTFDQVLYQIPFDNAKLFASGPDLLACLDSRKREGASDKELEALINSLLASTALSEQAITEWVTSKHSEGLIGKTLAKKYEASEEEGSSDA